MQVLFLGCLSAACVFLLIDIFSDFLKEILDK